jgi:uncharacterized phage protein (TIGR01671 family)
MNREIIFRVWNKRANKWIHGPGQEVNLFGETILLGEFMRVSLDELNDCVALQYTGLKDKNGKEICEGDILKFIPQLKNSDQFVGYVFYCEDDASFHHTYLYGRPSKRFWGQFVSWEYEIIGNIFENPELMQEPPTPEQVEKQFRSVEEASFKHRFDDLENPMK